MFRFARMVSTFTRRRGPKPNLGMALCCLPIALVTHSINSAECSGNEKDYSSTPIPKTLLLRELNKRMENLRKNSKIRKTLGPNGPEIKIRIEGKGKQEVHVMEIGNYNEQNIWNILSCWMSILGPGAIELHSISDAEGGKKVISFVSGTGGSSLVISSTPSGTTLSLFKDEGFTGNDLDDIVKGYGEAHKGSWQKRRAGFGMIQTPPDNLDQFIQDFFGEHSQYQDSSQLNNLPPFDQHAGHPVQSSRQSSGSGDPLTDLEALGVTVYTSGDGGGEDRLNWDSLAGYTSVKEEIKDSVLTPLLHPDVYDDIRQYTRESPLESNRPKAVLLEGPPGTGKTLTARILAREAGRPMVHLPVESIASKWYGESEKKLSQIFDNCDKLGGVVIFIDEVDALVGNRDNSQMHEATRRILSVILQRVEGFSGRGKNILVCATNRKQDLDKALISRFDVCIRYDLPDVETRKAIFKRYAKHLGRVALGELASKSEGLSSRDIKDICERAERKWASRMIAKGDMDAVKKELPLSHDYKESLEVKLATNAVQVE